MLAEIITIGDEILIGQIVDTNSAIIARELNKIGISVYQMTSIQDDRKHILQALSEAESRADIIILTGGLGPTRDDITKNTLCEYMDDSLVADPDVLAHIEELFSKNLSTPISEVHRQQAMVPSKAKILRNANGTAPGMWMVRNGKVFISLPGVQYEMQHMLVNEVIPKLITSFKRPYIVHRTIQTYGAGESTIAERIAHWEDNLPDFVKLAYLPNLGKVRLRLTAKGSSLEPLESAVEKATRELYAIIGDIIHGETDDESIEEVIAKNLTERKMTLAAAESFTGGRIAAQLTAFPGASRYFQGSIVSYATGVKIKLLQVPGELVEKYSVVSGEVAKAMAENARKLLDAHFAIATTGNAGPEKGDSDAEVGTVFIAIATPGGVFAEQFRMGNHRERIVQKSVHKAFEMLRKEILKF